MAGNTSPIFSKIGRVAYVGAAVLTANTTRDLTAGTIYLVATADATNGSRIDKLVIQPLGTNVATVLRIWINNGGVTTTAANNTLLRELTMAATTASEVAALTATETPLDLALPAAYKMYVTVGTGVAAGFHVTAIGGDF